MEWNFEGFIDEFGLPVFDTPTVDVYSSGGDKIEVGVIDHWENEVEGLKDDQDALNEFYRQFPRTTEHAFRDETKNSLFNLVKIYEQIDYNEGIRNSSVINTGNFQWSNGVKDTAVRFIPDPNGRFKISWTPEQRLLPQITDVTPQGERKIHTHGQRARSNRFTHLR